MKQSKARKPWIRVNNIYKTVSSVRGGYNVLLSDV